MSQIKTARNEAGFTLVELALTVVIALVISIMVVRFWITTSEAFILDTNIVTLKQQSERTIEIMSEKIRRANAATIVVSNGNSTIDFVDTFDGAAVRYEFQPPAPGGPPWGQIVQTASGMQVVLASYVENLQFTATPTGLVSVTAAFQTGSGNAQSRLTSQFSASARN
ncbi:MAG: hypothetical protein C4520_13565 [Candidatus Abyssobacteria bacterium SURF_5]|jgi:Tfp pilus assembly protein PilW|uniref:Prepilin-type N-terminal cleavage/methylation domain-containing protein n=1 Tax=Abyssobacteria bacterium (strain SURF_5) TaxID=2093360 RepID=A0A3A4NT22_ABYX5|nr:MAG: hypothetical protein C4520_13565 [Candidatus Abyssubacteria bacterium SURF_5]